MKNNLYVFFLFFITGLMSCSHHSGLYEHAEKMAQLQISVAYFCSIGLYFLV